MIVQNQAIQEYREEIRFLKKKLNKTKGREARAEIRREIDKLNQRITDLIDAIL